MSSVTANNTMDIPSSLRSFPNLLKASHVGTPLGTESAFPRMGTRGGEGGRFPDALERVSRKIIAAARHAAAIAMDDGIVGEEKEGGGRIAAKEYNCQPYIRDVNPGIRNIRENIEICLFWPDR